MPLAPPSGHIVGGGYTPVGTSSVGNIPKVVSIVPPTEDDSILRQTAGGAIIVGATDPSGAASETFRTAGGLISTGPGSNSTRIGRAVTVGGQRSVGIGDNITDNNAADNVMVGRDLTASSVTTNLMYGYALTAGGNNNVLIGNSLTTGAAANNCTLIGGSITVGAAVTNVIALSTQQGWAGGSPTPQTGHTYITHGTSGWVVIGNCDNTTGSGGTTRRLRSEDYSTGLNQIGSSLVISSGLGTGNGAASTIAFQTPAILGSGTTQQTRTTRLTISDAAITVDAGTNLLVNKDRGYTAANQVSSAAAAAGTLNNAPAAGNPAFWLRVVINGANHAIPCWLG